MENEIQDESRGEQFRLSMKAVEETGFSILERIEKRSEKVFDGVHSFMTGIEETDAYRLGNSYASCLRGVEAGVVELLSRRTVEGDVSAIEKTSRSAAAGVKELVKRLGKDDGKTVALLEDIQDELIGINKTLAGISKQMRVTENKDIKRWDALMSHLNRDRWWQVWKWSVWNFRVSFSRKED